MDICFLNYTVNNKHKFRLSSLDKDWTSQAITLPLFKSVFLRISPSHHLGQEDQHLLEARNDPLAPRGHLHLWVLLVQVLPGKHKM